MDEKNMDSAASEHLTNLRAVAKAFRPSNTH